MASEVDICKLALSHLGDEASITSIRPPDDSMQAKQCASFYPIALDALLEVFPWSFAVRRAQVAPITNPAADDWAYAYRLPSNCIRPLSALYPGVPERQLGEQSDAGSQPYIIESTSDGAAVMYSNVEAATLRYVHRVTDTSRYSPLFVAALARLLASYLAGPIIKGKAGAQVAQEHMRLFDREWRQAAVADANRGHRALWDRHTPSFIAARGGVPAVRDAQIIR